MTHQVLNEFILNYLDNDITGRAIMLTSEWGTGKSYYVKNTLKPFIDAKNKKCVIVSLYGFSEISEISKAIFLDIHPAIKKLTPAGNVAKIVGKTLLNGLASKIGFDIENLNEDTIKQLYESLDLSDTLIVLEDIERTEIEITRLLGYVNNLCENDGAKVLLITNEEELLKTYEKTNAEGKNVRCYTKLALEYKRSKEKAVGDTIRFTCDLENAIKNIVASFGDYLRDYCNKESVKDISDCFGFVGSFNLRAFIYGCQKSKSMFEFISGHNIILDSNIKKIIFYGIIAFTQRQSKNSSIKFDEDSYLSGRLGVNENIPLFRFCYDYIVFQMESESEIRKSLSYYTDYMKKGKWNSGKDKDLIIVKNFYIETEAHIIEALSNIPQKIKAGNIPYYDYGVIANYIVAIRYDAEIEFDIESIIKGKTNNENKHEYTRKLNSLNYDIKEIKELLGMLDKLIISEREKRLLHSNVLLISGKAGTGKSQLLAHEANLLSEDGRECLLLVSGIYYNNDSIQKQIMSNLNLEYSFNDLIDILEAIGEKTNRIIPVFIDALNETVNYKLWKTGLSSIVEKISKSNKVKLVLSYRSEYEKLILPDAVLSKKKRDEIEYILHNGFADMGIQAVKEFLNHYNIPFSPLEYFQFEMTNPLFLTLYCKTYNGSETSLPQLYDRLIESVNLKLFNSLNLSQNGYTEDINIIKPLIIEIASIFISNNRRYITEEELLKLDYWQNYRFSQKAVIHHLKGEGVLHTNVLNDQEEIFFSFDQMNDYFGAKAIFKHHFSKEEIRRYLSEELLGIKNGKLKNYDNITVFINCCWLYAEKFHEECIDIIDNVQNEYTRRELFNYYMESFSWRQSIYLSTAQFKQLCNKYSVNKENVWKMLIENGVKINHNFNADFLHSILLEYRLCDRDYLWTTYINDLPSNENERVIQLITLYNEGNKLEFTDHRQIEMLLTVWSWLLTSSNRWLRDNTSKAIIEILKEHFQYCQVILNKFRCVNDPYVVQRLYGCVFGACCKRVNTEEKNFAQLAEYIYSNLFNQEKVYPDILLRDYARLIIERFLHEYPDYNGIIERERIMPPYSSEPIPDIEDQHYLEGDKADAIYSIISSMRFDGMGMYGDFGRYVFQRSLRNFEVDEYKIFNYSVFYIVNELGFSNKCFKNHDLFCRNYDRHQTIKTERIGKKYQWITMFNLLARISDNCDMKESWYCSSDNKVKYEGPWEPYVRDFDPTLNSNFLINGDAPIFSILNEHRDNSIKEHRNEGALNNEKQENWINKEGYFLERLKHTLVLTDESKIQWVFLKKYCDTDRHNIEIDKLHEWSWLYAYFMSSSQVELCYKYIKKSKSVLSSEIASHFEMYTIFNREYPWAPSCRGIIAETLMDYSANTGEYEEVNLDSDNNELSFLEQILRKYGFDEEDKKVDDQTDGTANAKRRLKEIKKDIGSILVSTVELLWEEEYDASKENTINICHPCPKLIQDMNLQQKEKDGYYYDDTGKLAAFDTSLTQNTTGVLVRKDVLDNFLSLNKLKLVWFVDAEKDVHADGYLITKSSRWKGMYIYNNGNIEGDIHKINQY